ncbi:MAG TPA: AsmA-like C-terminal region-containing protein [Vicinamibacterales bacterium]|nr:AsmA-like C-terminal region-containing protein [Vicinamibacterales bacterium]
MRRIIVGSCLLVATGATVWLAWGIRPEHVRDRLIAAINERFDGHVEAESLDVSLLPKPSIAGTGVTLRLRDQGDVPPLITVPAFSASATFRGLIRRQIHLSHVSVERSEVHVPLGGLKDAINSDDSKRHIPHPERPSPIVIDEIRSRETLLQIATRKPGKLPRIFEIHDVIMFGFGLPEGAKFSGNLTNAIPRGQIETTGIFGPWHTDAPRLTPLSGQYSFKNANLNDIKGISGILSSVGQYRGTLERIEVDGQTETPDFSIDVAGQPVPLTTRFKAIVDGTNGDTFLDSVEADLDTSKILASGAIVRDQDVTGRHVALDIRILQARLEDLMRLAVKANKPPMTGRIDLTTTFLLPAGEADVVDRLRLDGRFSLAQARFANLNVQQRLTALSQRARGKEEGDPTVEGESVVSKVRGRFVLRNARLEFKELNFAIPGAEVQLTGSYNLRGEDLDFHGDLLIEASLADMTSGFKSLLARLAQPFFRRPGGGSRLPIQISGPREKPQFGLEMRRVFRRGEKAGA